MFCFIITLMLRTKLPMTPLIFSSVKFVRWRPLLSCLAVFPLAPAWTIERTAATLNGERNTFSEAPNCLATTYHKKKFLYYNTKIQNVMRNYSKRMLTWKREVENFVRADETSMESSTVTALCDVAAIAERWHRPNIIKRIAAKIGTPPVEKKLLLNQEKPADTIHIPKATPTLPPKFISQLLSYRTKYTGTSTGLSEILWQSCKYSLRIQA